MNKLDKYIEILEEVEEFKYTKIPFNFTVYNEPLYVLAQVLQYNLFKLKESNLDGNLDDKTKLKYRF
jgi:hypothetical protein